MQLPYSLTVGLLRSKTKWQARISFGERPADQSVGNQPLRTAYVFRIGGFWQPQKRWLYPTPADRSIPNQPLVPQYVFRPGGYWQPQNPWILPAAFTIIPVDSGVGNQPPLTAYVFRRGGIWRIQKSIQSDIATSLIVIQPPPPVTSTQVGGVPYSTQGRGSLAYIDFNDPHWRPKPGLLKEDLLLLYALGEIDEEVLMALFDWFEL